MLVGDRHGSVADERWPADEHLVEHDAEGVDVASAVDVEALRLLWREVRRGAHHESCLGHLVVDVPGRSRDTEVGDLDLPVRRDKHVAGLTSRWTTPWRCA